MRQRCGIDRVWASAGGRGRSDGLAGLRNLRNLFL